MQQKLETVEGTARLEEYGYDVRGRLTDTTVDGVAVFHQEYDENGNRLLRSGPEGTEEGVYDEQDRLLSYGGWVFTYGANGELESKTNTVTSDEWLYQYDALGNLLRVDLPDGTIIEYLIDGMNRRVGKKVNGVLTARWLYRDALKPVAELSGTGSLVSRFIYGTNQLIPDYVVKNGTTFRIVSDQLGSVRLVVNVATGAIAQKMRQDEWGNVLEDTTPGFTPFGFAGGLYDPDTQLVRFGERDYDPALGRWASKDPVLFMGDGPNLYAYALGDPCNEIDPSGLTTYVCQKPLDALSGKNAPEEKRHSGPESVLNPFYHQYLCVIQGSHVICGSSTTRHGTPLGRGVPSKDRFSDLRCTAVRGDDACLESCIATAILDPYRPFYSLTPLIGPGTNCQQWSDIVLDYCMDMCPVRP